MKVLIALVGITLFMNKVGAQVVFYRYENRIITMESDTTTIVIFHNENSQTGGVKVRLSEV